MIGIRIEGHRELRSSLQRYARAVGIDAVEATKEFARTGARQLAMRTEPMGLTGKAKKIGELAISKDVSLAYSSTARTYNELKKISPRKARAYGAAIEAGDHAAAERIIASLPNFYQVESTDSGQHLESIRNSKGRVASPSIVNLTQEGAVSAIRREKLATAGTAKAGWVSAGQSIGSTSRFPAWLRKNKPLGRSRVIKRSWDTAVILSNLVKYASSVLPLDKLRAALKAAQANQVKRIALLLRKRSESV